MNKQFLRGILLGYLILIYYLTRKVLAKYFNYPQPPQLLNLPLIAGTAITTLTFVIFGFKNGVITLALITTTLAIENYLQGSNKEVNL